MKGCVHCSRPRDHHDPDGNCLPLSYKTKFATMDLPEGKTCQDCFAFRRFCEPIIGVRPTSTECDYFPVRFVQLPTGRGV